MQPLSCGPGCGQGSGAAGRWGSLWGTLPVSMQAARTYLHDDKPSPAQWNFPFLH